MWVIALHMLGPCIKRGDARLRLIDFDVHGNVTEAIIRQLESTNEKATIRPRLPFEIIEHLQTWLDEQTFKMLFASTHGYGTVDTTNRVILPSLWQVTGFQNLSFIRVW
jgi:hypothetical protein